MIDITAKSKTCSVQDCDKEVFVKGLCDMHRKRLERNGHLEAVTPDWGKREKHPLYSIWERIKHSKELNGLPSRWSDFWLFVEDVKERPGENYFLYRKDSSLPFSADNCHWREVTKLTRDVDKRQRNIEYAKVYRLNNKEKIRNSQLLKNYDITIMDYREMLHSQNGVCAICYNPERILNARTGQIKDLAVDHCHKTGEIRGLLCSSCNIGLGSFGDNPEFLKSAVEYLTQ